MFNVNSSLTSHAIRPNATDDITFAHVGTKNGILGYFEVAPAQSQNSSQSLQNSLSSPSTNSSTDDSVDQDELQNENLDPLGVIKSNLKDPNYSSIIILVITTILPILIGVIVTILFYVIEEHRRQLKLRAEFYNREDH